MKICIGITTKNRADILPRSIQSALDQEYQNKEIIVFNDGSTDGTSELCNSFPNVRWMGNAESVGLLNARNLMMRNTDADLFVSLDDDAWFLSNDEIKIAAKRMEQNPNLGAIAFDVLQNETKRFKKVQREEPIGVNVFIGCGHMLRLSAVKRAGYYIPFPVKYGHEEKDLCIRMLDHNYEIEFLPGVHVWHDYSSIERNLNDQRRSFIINDLVYPFRRVPILFLGPVMCVKLYEKLKSKEDDSVISREAIGTFIKLIPKLFKFSGRVRMSTYLKYRNKSKSYFNYLAQHNQNVETISIKPNKTV